MVADLVREDLGTHLRSEAKVTEKVFCKNIFLYLRPGSTWRGVLADITVLTNSHCYFAGESRPTGMYSQWQSLYILQYTQHNKVTLVNSVTDCGRLSQSVACHCVEYGVCCSLGKFADWIIIDCTNSISNLPKNICNGRIHAVLRIISLCCNFIG